MFLSKSCGYAVRGIIYLALKNDEKRKISIEEISEELSVPQPFMSKIMQELVRKRLISSTKGPNGGFFMNNLTQQAKIIDVVEAIDGLGEKYKCGLGLPECNAEKPCPLHHDLAIIRDNFFELIEKQKVVDLIEGLEDGSTFLNREVFSH